MFDLHAPWWELPVRAAIVYGALLVLMRLSGRRTVGQFTPFDLLVVMLLSESVSQGLSGGEDSVTGALLAAGTLIGINMAVTYVASRNTRVQRALEGSAVLVGKDGRILTQVLEKQRVPASDMEQALREADCELADMKRAFLESDGTISILKKSGGRP